MTFEEWIDKVKALRNDYTGTDQPFKEIVVGVPDLGNASLTLGDETVKLSDQAKAMLTSDFVISHKLFSPSMTPSAFNEIMTMYDAAKEGNNETVEIDEEDMGAYTAFLELENIMRGAAGVESITSLAADYPLFLWYLFVPYYNIEPTGLKIDTHFDETKPVEVTPTPVEPIAQAL
jgi:hypothetical protein